MSPKSDDRERMLTGLPVRTSTIDIHGVTTAVIEAGDGPPLLLLHGGIECGGVMWAPVLAQLARQHRVVVPDVPGFGQSAPVPDLDVETFGRWLTGVAEYTDPRAADRRRPLARRRPRHPARHSRQLHDRTARRLRHAQCRRISAAAGASIRRDPLRGPPHPSQRRALRSLRTLRCRRHTSSRCGLVRRLSDLYVVPRSGASCEEGDVSTRRHSNQAHCRCGPRSHRHPDHSSVGTPRSHGAALDRRSRRVSPRLAPASHRRRWPRAPHRATRGLRRDAHRCPVRELSSQLDPPATRRASTDNLV